MRAYTSERGDLTVLRLPPGADLLPALNDAAQDLGIDAAWVNVIGAFRHLVYGHYDEEAGDYRRLEHRGFLEIGSAMGNVSVKDGRPFTHLHVVVGDADGRAYAGHLLEGSEVFVAEVAFHRLVGAAPVREPDETTGLDMWSVE